MYRVSRNASNNSRRIMSVGVVPGACGAVLHASLTRSKVKLPLGSNSTCCSLEVQLLNSQLRKPWCSRDSHNFIPVLSCARVLAVVCHQRDVDFWQIRHGSEVWPPSRGQSIQNWPCTWQACQPQAQDLQASQASITTEGKTHHVCRYCLLVHTHNQCYNVIISAISDTMLKACHETWWVMTPQCEKNEIFNLRI